jgi:CheY-like chemotaxis protein
MVTAKGAEIDTVVGLEVGADDYVTKPYRLRELTARMRAVMRRVPTERGGELSGSSIEIGDVALDPDQHEVIIRGDAQALPLKEFELLHILLANAGRVLPRETLIDRVWEVITWAIQRRLMFTSNGFARKLKMIQLIPRASSPFVVWDTSTTNNERRNICAWLKHADLEM